MKPHTRALIFCVALLVCPLLYALGDRVAGLPGAVLLPGIATLGSLLYAWLGGGGEPPVGAPPS
jgi:hypothetical protein